MLPKSFSNIVSVLGVAEACWAGYNWFNGANIVFGAVLIGPAEWFAFSVAGGLVALFAGFHFVKTPIGWIKKQTSAYKFTSLEYAIEVHRQNTEGLRDRSDLLTERISIFQKLDSLNIETPEIGNDRQWVVFSIYLQPLAEVGNVREARALMTQLKNTKEWSNKKKVTEHEV